MTVQTNTNSIAYVGNGSTVHFDYDFLILDASHLKVYFGDVLQTSGYVVSGVLSQTGGTVAFAVAPPNGTAITLTRSVPFLQLTDYQPYDAFPAESHERALDLLTMQTQQLKDSADRSMQYPVGGNKWDAKNNEIINVATGSSDTSAPNVGQVKSLIAQLAGPDSAAQLRVDLAASDGAGSVGGATFSEIRAYTGPSKFIRCVGKASNDRTGAWAGYYRDDADTATADNGGTVLVDALGRRWKIDFQKNHTGMFWEEYGALIHRVGDRLLVGDAIKNGANVQNQPDWLTQYQIATGRSFGFSQSGQMVVQNGVGSNETGASNAIVAGAQTAHLNDNFNSIGVLGIAVANKPTGTGNAYGGYFEGFRHNNAIGGAYGVEIDSVTYATCGPTDPYQQAANQVIGLQLAAGAELSPTGQFPSNAAINIRNNGATYTRGIIFGADALTGCNGVTGTAIAVQMAKGHGLVWYSGPNQSTSSIYGLSTDYTKSNGIVLGDDSLAFVQNIDGKKIFDAEHSVSGAGVNYPAVRGSGAGAPVQILARGSDTNIDIHLVPKGSAYIRFGQWTGQGDQAINGYIAIRDSAGNIRKIPTIA